MEFIYVLILAITGLGVLLYGMSIFARAIETGVGSRLNYKFIKISYSPVRGCGFVAGLTFLLQKTTLVTSMLTNYTSLGSITLRQSLPMAIGISIGSALTLVIMIFQGLNLTIFLTICCFFGAMINLFVKSDRAKLLARALMGFGLIFLGIHLVGDYAGQIFQIPSVYNFLSSIGHPIVIMIFALLTGLATTSTFCAITLLATLVGVSGVGPIDISCACIGMLAVPIGTSTADYIYTTSGQDINTKRIALFRILTCIFAFVVMAPLYFIGIYQSIFTALGDNTILTLILVYTIQMVFTAILIPFSPLLEKLMVKILPDKKKKVEGYLDFVIPESHIASFSTGYVSILNSIKSLFELNQKVFNMAMQKIINKTESRGIQGQVQGIEKAIKITMNTVLRVSMHTSSDNLQKTQMLNYVLNDCRYIVKKAKELSDDASEYIEKPKILTQNEINNLIDIQQKVLSLSGMVKELAVSLMNSQPLLNENLKEIFELNQSISTQCKKLRKDVYASYKTKGGYPESNMYFLILQNLEDTNTVWNDIAIKFGILAS